jgi:membrane fusion protein (multidrug efflux system)
MKAKTIRFLGTLPAIWVNRMLSNWKNLDPVFRARPFILLILLGSWTLPFCVTFSGCKSKEKAAPPAPPEVLVTEIEQKNVPIYKEWVGTLDGDVTANIRAQVSGYLTNRAYTEGARVTNGQVLFQLDSATYEAALSKAKAALAQAEATKRRTKLDVERYTALAKTEAVSRQELDDAISADASADAQIEGAAAAIQTARINLDFATIRSPINGMAGLAKAQIGDLVGPASGALTSVSTIDPIRAYFSVSEQLVYKALEKRAAAVEQRRGSGIELELILAGGDIYPEKGRTRFADNQVDVKTGTVTLVGEFPNPKGVLTPGMFARIRAMIGVQTNALLAPQRAVAEMQGKYLLAIVGQDNKVAIRPVSVSERVGEQWIVISKDLKPGTRIVAEGIQKVRDGVTVTPKPWNEGENTSAGEETKPAAGKQI